MKKNDKKKRPQKKTFVKPKLKKHSKISSSPAGIFTSVCCGVEEMDEQYTKVSNSQALMSENEHLYFKNIGIELSRRCNVRCPHCLTAANPRVKGKVVVHHAIEQQVLKRHPNLFSKAEIHSLENLRGIPKSLNPDIHLSKIRKSWNRFYKNNPNPTRQQFLNEATEIDNLFGHLFTPPIRQEKNALYS